ncbi:MAG: DMT family transporter [Desulfobacterales bacterium]|nr:DMT family transporter [Desulfobacterales bacterium]
MEAVIFALLSCICWASAGFIGGFKNKTVHILYILAASYITGFVIISIVVTVRSRGFPMDSHLLYGAFAGMIAPIAVGCLLRGLSVGKMGVISAIAATGVLIPLIYDLVLGNYPNIYQFAGMIMAIIGVMIISLENAGHQNGKRIVAGVGLALCSAFLFGFFNLFIDAASNIDPFWTIFCLRVSSLVCISFALAVKRPKLEFTRRDLPVMLSMGLFETGGSLFFALASTKGLVSVISVIIAINPAVVALLAFFILKQQLSRKQITGISVALAGVSIIVYG